MKALLLVESRFGNSRAIADAVALGIRERGAEVTVLAPEEAPPAVGEDVDLLVLGAPTHNRTLPTSSTRGQAVAMGAEPGGDGVREWLSNGRLRSGLRVAAFTTASGRTVLSGSAARGAARLIARSNPGVPVETRTFVVDGLKGPLQEGEVEAARTWGRDLVEAHP
ncbi:MAG: flavodoxin family protein [Nigerium sp.]|nr:flavodoxin family protein [Nigerium sp.]